MKLQTVFDTIEEYDTAKGNEDISYPNVSYIVEDDNIYYMPKPLRNYLYIEALADGMTVTLNNTSQGMNAPANELEYSTDQQVWSRLPNNTTSPTINTGERIYLRGNATVGDAANNTLGIGFFNITRPCNVGGNIMSLLFNDDFEDKTDLTGYDMAFFGLFTQQPIVNASELILPAATLTEACYYGMFAGCPLLTTAPELPAATLTEACYMAMFAGCSNLNYIKMLATDISAESCLSGWVAEVSSTGTFVKNPALSVETIGIGVSGIPEGWTEVDYSAPGTYLPEYDTTGLATHFVVGEAYANVLPLYQTIFDQYGNSTIIKATSMLEYINESDENVQIYIGNEPLYQNYLSKLTFSMSNDGTSENPNYLYFENDGLTLYDSNSYNQVTIIRETFGNEVVGQCINSSLA